MVPVAAVPQGQVAGDFRRLVLDEGCTLADAPALQARLLAAAPVGDPSVRFALIVDGGAVARVDSAGLQLLVALALREAGAGRRLAWKCASPALLQASRQLGLVEALGLAALAAESR